MHPNGPDKRASGLDTRYLGGSTGAFRRLAKVHWCENPGCVEAAYRGIEIELLWLVSMLSEHARVGSRSFTYGKVRLHKYPFLDVAARR